MAHAKAELRSRKDIPGSPQGVLPTRAGEDLLVFELAGQRYALPVIQVREVLPRATLARLPEGPAALAGILRLRGALLPVVDLRRRLGLQEVAPQIGHRIVVAQVDAQRIGLLVDAVHGLMVPAEQSWPAAPDEPVPLIHGVVEVSGHVVTVLNLETLISAELVQFLAVTLRERSRAPYGERSVSQQHGGAL